MKGKAGLLAICASVAAAAPADAATYLCVPTTAGLAVTSGGSSGTCSSTATRVQMPESQTDQQTLISMLPYMSFNASGIGGKPTITIKGANLWMVRGTAGPSGDGTANILMGGGPTHYWQPTQITGSENMIVGYNHTVSGNNNVISGRQHSLAGSFGIAGGFGNETTTTGNESVVFGFANRITGQLNSLLGGANNLVSGRYAALDGGLRRTVAADYGGAEDVEFISYAADGTVRGRSRADIVAYSAGVGMKWINVPRGKLTKCAIAATPVNDDPNVIARRMYDTYYDEWALVATTAGGRYVDSAVNVSISCPTTF